MDFDLSEDYDAFSGTSMWLSIKLAVQGFSSCNYTMDISLKSFL